MRRKTWRVREECREERMRKPFELRKNEDRNESATLKSGGRMCRATLESKGRKN